MNNSRSKINASSGFTLIELAVVLVIIGVILSGFLGSLSSRVEQSKRQQTKQQLNDISSALLGFASANGRLPCPTRTTNSGEEAPVGGGVCTNAHGFVPAKTLGLSGAYNRDTLLLDSWNNPIRYSVTTSNTSAFTNGAMQATGMGTLTPNLIVCPQASTSGTSCTTGNEIVENAPFIVLSLGSDGASFVSNAFPLTDQGENSSEVAVAANATGENLAYVVANDRVFVDQTYKDTGVASSRFDDLIIWVSPYVLYSRMIEAGQLP